MDTTLETTKPGHPFVAGFWLITAIPIFALIALPIMTALGSDDLYALPGLLIMFLAHFGAGYLWARSLGKRSGLPDNRMMNISGGIGFAFFMVGTLIALTGFAKAPIDRWLALFKGVGNLEFGALFAPLTGLISGGTGFALGLGLRDWKLALKLLALGFISGLGLYLAIMFSMELLGFKVGSGRPVMIPTTFMSMWSAALVGSAIFGSLLVKSGVAERRNPP